MIIFSFNPTVPHDIIHDYGFLGAPKMEANHNPSPAGRSPMIRRSMLVVLAGLTVILAAFFAVRSSSLWYWTPLTERSILKLYTLDTAPEKFEVLILGASIAEFAFYPDMIEKELRAKLPPSPAPGEHAVYNASIQAAFLPTYLEILRNIVGDSQQPRAVMLAVSPRDFNGSSYRVQRQVRFLARSPSDLWLVFAKAGNPAQRWSAFHALTHGLEVLVQAPLYPLYRDDVDYFRRGHGRILLDHYPVLRSVMERDVNNDITPEFFERLRQNGVTEVREHQVNDFAINDLIDSWTRAIIAEARLKNLRLAVVLMPATEWFDRNAFGDNLRLTREYIARVCAETGTPFYDLRDPRFRPDDGNYFDGCDHLSMEGAGPLSKAVTDEIIIPLLTGDQPAAPTPAPGDTTSIQSNGPPPPEGKPIPGRAGFDLAPAVGATPVP